MTECQLLAMKVLDMYKLRVDRLLISKKIQRLNREMEEILAKKRKPRRPKPTKGY